MTCSVCKGHGMVHRRVEKVVTERTECVKDVYGHWQDVDTSEVAVLGGIDACPRCTDNAEMDYREYKAIVAREKSV